jgi:hypothetical protein
MSRFSDCGAGVDRPNVGALVIPDHECLRWHAHWTIDKRWGNWTGEDIDAGRAPEPYETVEVPYNGLLKAGITMLLGRLIGGFDADFPAYSSGNAYIKVGNSTTAFSSGQADILGASSGQAAMDAGYPLVQALVNEAPGAVWRATFGTTEANFAWEEIGVKNGSGFISATTVVLNRRVQGLGTKVSTATWTVTLTIKFS